jgi:hypothetical protein
VDKPAQQPEQKTIKQQEQQVTRPAIQQKPVQPRPQSSSLETTADKQKKSTQPRPPQSLQEKKQPATPVQPSHVSEVKPKRIPATWNDAMMGSAHAWLSKTLELMNMNSIAFNSEIAGKNLKLTFNMPLIADVTHEKQLFRSLAHLIMSSLRNQYKQEIRDLKVILIRPE